MKRIHLFEFEDQEWFPSLFRSFITDLLHYQLTSFDMYISIIPKLKNIIETLKCQTIVDLCSGSIGPIIQVQQILKTTYNYPVSIILTDKYPNLEAFQKLCDSSSESIKFIDYSVDATSVPSEIQGFRTLFTSFHHFNASQAQKILQDAVDKQIGIGIFEFTERTLVNFLKVIFFAPLLVWLQTPFIRPIKLSRFFWTYLIPIIPFVYAWDALVSHLRTYSVKELRLLISKVKYNNYTWEVGQASSKKTGFNITYLIGYPTNISG